MTKQDTNNFRLRSATARYGWCWITRRASVALGGNHLDRGQNWLHRARPCAIGLKKAERDNGRAPGLTTEMAARLKALERENRELRQANEILRKASAYFAQAELDRRHKP